MDGIIFHLFRHTPTKMTSSPHIKFPLSFYTYYVIMPAIMESQPKFRPDPKQNLMDQVKEVLRYHHYAYRTEQTYCQWVLRYIRFFDNTHPQNLNSKNRSMISIGG